MAKKKKPARRRYDWRPDLPDYRDHLFMPPILAPKALPAVVDLRGECSPVVNQGRIGSCTGNALAGAFEYLELQELKIPPVDGEKRTAVFNKNKFMAVSRLFIYYNERSLEGTVDQDAGGRLRDGVKSLIHWGACTEKTWAYRPSLVYKKPSIKAYAEGGKHAVTEYLKLNTLMQIKQCLATGFPVVFGFSVYESFEGAAVAKTGYMPLPETGEHLLGGHAVMAVGFDDTRRLLIARNSWGDEWGDQGYFYMPYAYLEQLGLAQDFWTLRR